MSNSENNGNNNSIMARWLATSQNTFRPMQASLELTNRCNERCTHCYLTTYEDDKSRLLTLEQWKTVLNQLRQAGVLYVILMGGEAMLSPNFWEIAEEGCRLGFSMAMITNGLLIDEPAAQRLSKMGFSDVTISLYSLNPDIHDKMTKVYGSCRRTLRAIELCRANGLRVSINCLLTEANIEEYFALHAWCKRQHLQLRFDPIITPKFNGDLGPTTFRARPDQIQEFYKKLYLLNPRKKPAQNEDLSEGHVCNAGKGKCAVTAYGDLLTCIDIREPLGNLVTQNFSEIWESHVANKWRHIRQKDVDFTDNTLAPHCEHCPGMAHNETGNALKATEYEIIVAKAKIQALASIHKPTGEIYDGPKETQP